MKKKTCISIFAIAAATAACSGGSDSSGNVATPGTGTLRVAMTDAPACGYDEVNVTVTKVRVNRSEAATDEDGSWSEVAVTPERKINLLDLQNGLLFELGDMTLSAGHYSQVRLVLAPEATAGSPPNSLVLTSDATKAEIPLRTPSGQQSGLKLVHGFDIAAGETKDLVLDFDACRSVVKAGNSGNYNLKPVISVIPIDPVGKVEIGGQLGIDGANATVSAQVMEAGMPKVVRTTTSDANGAYTLSPMIASGTGFYTLVVTKPGFATHVVTDVPAAAGALTTVPLLQLQSAPHASISGGVSLPQALEAYGGEVRAVQNLGGTFGWIEVANSTMGPADSVTRTYSVDVSTGQTKRATYPATSFVDVPSLYQVEASVSAPDVVKQLAPTIFPAGDLPKVHNFTFMAGLLALRHGSSVPIARGPLTRP